MNWKKFSLWSGLGGLVFGTAVYAIKKSSARPPLYSEAIPQGVQRIIIEMQPLANLEGSEEVWVQQCYALEPTSFYVWSVLPASRSVPRASRGLVVSETQGTQVFYIVPTLRRWRGGDQGPGTEKAEEGFYATIRIHAERVRKSLVSQIARDYPLEFRKCLVGGSSNGIETGEILTTQQPVLDYRFEMDDA